ncbi:MAG: PAS/PAC sensor signal transduction histidine kinase [uncultured bacterium]|nr:MAG: PAS/PAC sensor signal transduction histidine kinase [uncultured bacterium]HBR71375.1 hypothetical protein [Candidatus Moranbacteria bacterium]
MMYLIIVASALNFFIGMLALRNAPKNKLAFAFIYMCFVTGFWSLSNFLMYFYDTTIFLKVVYAIGDMTATALLGWVFFYDEKNKKYWKHFLIYLSGFVITVVTLIDGLVIKEARGVSIGGVDADPGILFNLWGFHMMVMIIWAILKTARLYFKQEGEKRIQARYVLAGVGGFASTSLLVSVILPAFGIFSITNLDSPSSLFFAIFIGIAMVKHEFLGKKVVASQLLVAILISIISVEIFYSSNAFEIIMRLIVFIVVFIVGAILVESVANENRQKEKLQSLVNELEFVNKNLGKTTEKLQKANEKLQELDRVKSEFLSIASHQLRSPLMIIKNFSRMVLDGAYGKASKEILHVNERICKNSDRLLDLISDFLNFSRLESGKIKYDFDFYDLKEVVKEIVENYKINAEDKKLELNLKISENFPDKIYIDKRKIYEVINNLVDNAIKYTNVGKVDVVLSRKDDEVLISIIDTGVGILKNDLDKLFGKFARGSKITKLEVNGTGLGLFVGKKFIEAHGGNIKVHSEGENKGSEFIIEIPIKEK